MKNQFLYVSFISLLFVVSCDKETEQTLLPVNQHKANAEIIGFNPDKCSCCWGWIIRIGIDTIKADSLPNVDRIGMNISAPITVYIELGEKKMSCSTLSVTNPINNKDYYHIKKLVLIE